MFDLSAIDASVVAYVSTLLGLEPVSILFPIARMLCAILFGTAIYFLVKKTFVTIVRNIIIKREWKFGSYLIKHKLFTHTLKLVPVAIVINMAERVGNPLLASIMSVSGELIMIVLMGMLVMSVINAFVDIIQHRKGSRHVPVKTFAQLIKIIVVMACSIAVIAKASGQSPTVFLSGLGAITAWLMLIFKDTLLGMVAGVQISAHKIMREGDWVCIPALGVDGEVIDITLNAIMFKAWDNSTITLPAHKVLNESVINWSSMYGNGRRIKESIFIDSGSIRFLTDDEIEGLKEVDLLRGYLISKMGELQTVNKQIADNKVKALNGRRLTNIGTFRAFVKAYLQQHEEIAKSQTILVRKRDTGAHGVPMEIYAFTSNTGWADHEQIKCDIFDYLYAVMPLFGLRQYQSPSSFDMQSIGRKDTFMNLVDDNTVYLTEQKAS